MLETLDAIIATAAVALGLSLIVQAVQQIMKHWFDLKSNYMRFQLLAMFSSPQPPEKRQGLRTLKPITRQMGDADDRARSIVEQIEAAVKSFGYRDLELLEKVSIDDMKRIAASLPMFGKAKEKLKEVEKEIEIWFEITKRAFQDLYERKMKLWSFIISGVVVIVLNANLLEIYREFSTNKTVRDAAVAMAEKFVAVPRDSLLVIDRTAARETTYVVSKPDSLIVRDIQASLDEIRQVASSNTFQVFRWTKARLNPFVSDRWLVVWIRAILGWLAMTLLVSLGAPFWYDFLKTVMGIKERMKK
ncbi:MAG: hypothetical protein FJ217_14820 [Ignavibacteria bacterium]|nr:hypothetical protein [Ignavibacteria bacterium]